MARSGDYSSPAGMEEGGLTRSRSRCNSVSGLDSVSPKGGEENADFEATELPLQSLAAIFLAMLGGTYPMSYHLPFIKFMMMDFGYSLRDSDHMSGIITSAFFAGRACGSYVWGALSDGWLGKRKCLMINLVGIALSSFAFGFSESWQMAFALRFLCGAVNGVTAISKTLVSIVCDDTNISIGMNAVSTSAGLGILLGPALGGLLAMPGQKYPGIFADTIFDTYEYLLPCVVNVLFCAVAIVSVLFWLPSDETVAECENKNATRAEPDVMVSSSGGGERGVLERRATVPCVCVAAPFSTTARASVCIEDDRKDEEDFLPSTDARRDSMVSIDSISHSTGCCACLGTLGRLINNMPFILSVVIHGIDAMMLSVFDLVVNLWCLAPLHLGGLEFTTSQIGFVLSMTAGVYLVAQVTLYPIFFSSADGHIRLKYLRLKAVLMIVVGGFGFLSLFRRYDFPMWTLYGALIVGMAIVKFGIASSFTIVSVFVCNAVLNEASIKKIEQLERGKRKAHDRHVVSERSPLINASAGEKVRDIEEDVPIGSANGLNVTVGEIFRAIGPIVFASVYSFTKHEPFVRNIESHWVRMIFEYMVFYLGAAMFLICFLLAKALPKDIEHRTSSGRA
eukprot:Nk52_evm11s157 gene=Nk52_evmTU11s157